MKLKKGARIAIVVGVFLILAVVVGWFFLRQNSLHKPAEEVKIVNEIKEYGYSLKETKSKKYKDLFQELKTVLSKEEVDEEKYASLISEMFILDLYTLANKVAKTDIGGVDFVHPDVKVDFLEKAMDTIYKYVESNLDGDRKQELPTVKEVKVESVESTSFKYGDEKDNNAYQVKVTWDYEKDLGYETEAALMLVHDGKKLCIVEMD